MESVNSGTLDLVSLINNVINLPAFMKSRLKTVLLEMDGKGYGQVKRIKGQYEEEGIALRFLTTPADPFAPPGRIFVTLKNDYPPELWSTPTRRLALSHFLLSKISTINQKEIAIQRPSSAVLKRNSASIGSLIELRFDYHIPARGRRILGRKAVSLFDSMLLVVERYRYHNLNELEKRVLISLEESLEDQEELREKLREEGYACFIANGSKLVKNVDIVPFDAPERLKVSFKLKHREVEGLAIKKGKLVVITGANYHGKSTLLEAMGVAHYLFEPGDGREFVKSPEQLVFANKENRRAVKGVDISSFIHSLPDKQDTSSFTTVEASGSTSQAACIAETLEAGEAGMLIDEDDSAVNLLIKDNRLKHLIPDEIEPIIPLLDTVRDMVKRYGITVILVIGALGEFSEIAEIIIMMRNFRVEDRTEELQSFKGRVEVELEPEIAREIPPEIKSKLDEIKATMREEHLPFNPVKRRRPAEDFTCRGKRKVIGMEEIRVEEKKTDLRGDMQKILMEKGQINALADAVQYAGRYMDGRRSLQEIATMVVEDVEKNGLDVIGSKLRNYSGFTMWQLIYCLNRLVFFL
ncbi:MAG: hypothetical protein EF807_04265 [Candidatus Methanolliviera hydrocarbonicum]|uniref:ABC transporter domain-containing protein n=1 Tax=Candidatus Methanolliviera hydrocarbonicum TaxID=2491085 RepID=A0A520KWS2_9EURY|nr:MAG: hypothetical protein EF807_04265 [Candidatus Methanolliviera hydrocarbonicum]